MTELQQQIWATLGTPTRRAVRKESGRFGRRYQYRPRGTLLSRLSETFNITEEQAYLELQEIRGFWLSQP